MDLRTLRRVKKPVTETNALWVHSHEALRVVGIRQSRVWGPGAGEGSQDLEFQFYKVE